MTETPLAPRSPCALLERQGIRTCRHPGGAILPIYDALGHRPSLHHVLARHEQGAGFMAQGMAVPAASRRSVSPHPGRVQPTC